jgi:hypothetical protein
LRRSGRSNKGKAPAMPDAMEVDQPKRGKKRSAPTAARGDEEHSSGNSGGEGDGDPTPRKTATGHPLFNVVINSPPNTRPKQRLRMDAETEAAETSVAEKAAAVEKAAAEEKAAVAAAEKAAAERVAAEKAAAEEAAAVRAAVEAADAVELAEAVEAAEVADAAAVGAASEKLWVGTGEVCQY